MALVALALCWPDVADAQRRKRRKRRKPKAPAAEKSDSAKTPAPTPDAKDDGDPGATVKERKKKDGKEQVFDFTGLQLQSSMRTPQLLYFLDRATEELERASLERRSFVPEMVRSLDEEAL